MSEFIVGQEVVVEISGEFAIIERVIHTENGIRYQLSGRPSDVLYHSDMFYDSSETRQRMKEKQRNVVANVGYDYTLNPVLFTPAYDSDYSSSSYNDCSSSDSGSSSSSSCD